MRCSANIFFALIGVMATFGFSACAKDKPSGTAAMPKTAADYFEIKLGDKPARLQLAVLDLEQERGLMERRDLGRDEGMIFVYAKPRQMRFWMHNTPTPLDIGFFDAEGVLLEIYAMQPFDENTVNSRSAHVKFPVEMKQGWFHENGVRPGARLDLDALAAALKARGFDPKKFGWETVAAR